MHFSIPAAAVALSAASLVAAAPAAVDDIPAMKRNYIERLSKRSSLAKRQSTTTGASDAVVLNFALTLEHLEAQFYKQGLQNYTQAMFQSAGLNGVYPLLQQVASDEANHVEFLTTALSAAGATPVQACNYTFPSTDVTSFLAVSQILEGVGVSAYLGAAGSINTTAYLTAAGSILTVEARHAAFVRYLNQYSPFPQPNDTPLSAAAVVTLATPFFASCPSGSAPAIMGHPALTLGTTNVTAGSTIQLTPTNTSAVPQGQTIYCGFASGLSSAFSEWSNNSCQVPTANITNGQTYVFLTTGPSVSDASVVAGPAAFEYGPKNVTLLARNNATSSGGASGSSGSGSSGASPSGGASGGSSGGSSGGAASGANMVVASGALSVLAGAVALLF